VRHVGEAIAVIIAETMAQAQDAAELITLDTEDLPVALDLSGGGAALHPEAPGNIAYDWALGEEEAVETTLAASAHRVALTVVHNRVIVNSLEPRAAYAEWNGARLHLCVNGQGVWMQKGELARMLHLPPEAVRVTTPDVGGGFGMKAMTYPEYIVISHAARVLGRAVRWASDRTEAMLSDTAGRDLIARAEMGFDAAHRITAYRVRVSSNLGAYNSVSGQEIQSDLFAKVLTGCYDIPLAFLGTEGVFTNTTPVDAYRGAGRPEAIYTIERMMDHAARELGVDPVALREANFIRHFPYTTATGEYVDVGDFPRVLTRALTEADAAGFPARRAESAARGKLRGLGLCCYIESILGDSHEDATIEFALDGSVLLYVGTQSNGQGHETVYAQFLSDRTGLPFESIRIVQGDRPDRLGGGHGRLTLGHGAIGGDAGRGGKDDGGLPCVSRTELDAPGVTFDVRASLPRPARTCTLTLAEAADLAPPRGREDLLSHQAARWHAGGRSFPNGAHLAEIEVDPETGGTTLLRYTVTDDFGRADAPDARRGAGAWRRGAGLRVRR
jgi:aerobic carbon-monoxide dehydrogenase large subunit